MMVDYYGAKLLVNGGLAKWVLAGDCPLNKPVIIKKAWL